MKKVILLLVALGLVAGVATVWATVIGSPHDIAPEPCAMCHTPHSGAGVYPLWNRSQDAQTYTMYSSISFDMGPANTSGPRNPSALCLVCHNGVASTLVNYPGPCSNPDAAYDFQIAGCAELGTDLTDDHPVSFNYNNALDLDLNNFPAATIIRNTAAGVRYAIQGATANYMLYGEAGATDWFECATCHSVHDLADYPGKGTSQVYFLRSDNTGSAMCLDCHTAR